VDRGRAARRGRCGGVFVKPLDYFSLISRRMLAACTTSPTALSTPLAIYAAESDLVSLRDVAV
jgi:hypothetical protein